MKFFSIILLSILLLSCSKHRDEIKALHDEINRLEQLIEANQKLYESLKLAYESNQQITSITETENNYTLILEDGTIIEIIKEVILSSPYIGSNGNWFVNGEDTGVKAQGENGQEGSTPYIGENGNWWVGSEDTGVKAGGIYGPLPYIGENGNWWIGTTDTGIDPSNGDTPFIGENGNWWIGDVDTGIKDEAKDGEDAPKIVAIRQAGNTIEFEFDNGEILTMLVDLSNLEQSLWENSFSKGSASNTIAIGDDLLLYTVQFNNLEGQIVMIDLYGREVWTLSFENIIINSNTTEIEITKILFLEDIIHVLTNEGGASHLIQLSLDGNILNILSSFTRAKSFTYRNGFYYIIDVSSLKKYSDDGTEIWASNDFKYPIIPFDVIFNNDGNLQIVAQDATSSNVVPVFGSCDENGNLIMIQSYPTSQTLFFQEIQKYGDKFIVKVTNDNQSTKPNSYFRLIDSNGGYGDIIRGDNSYFVEDYSTDQEYLYYLDHVSSPPTGTKLYCMNPNTDELIYLKTFEGKVYNSISLVSNKLLWIGGEEQNNYLISLSDLYKNH